MRYHDWRLSVLAGLLASSATSLVVAESAWDPSSHEVQSGEIFLDPARLVDDEPTDVKLAAAQEGGASNATSQPKPATAPPKPKPAQATPAKPKPTSAQAAPAKPKPAGTTVAPAKPKPTGAAPAKPKPAGAAGTPAKPKPAGTAGAAAKPKPAGTQASPAKPKPTSATATPAKPSDQGSQAPMEGETSVRPQETVGAAGPASAEPKDSEHPAAESDEEMEIGAQAASKPAASDGGSTTDSMVTSATTSSARQVPPTGEDSAEGLSAENAQSGSGDKDSLKNQENLDKVSASPENPLIANTDTKAEISVSSDASQSEGALETAAGDAPAHGEGKSPDLNYAADPEDGEPGQGKSDREVVLEQQIADLEARLGAVETTMSQQREHAFVKGWLAGVGDVNFIPDKHQVMVGLQLFPVEEAAGETITNRTFYLGAVPRISLHFGKLLMGFELPLAFQVFQTEIDSTNPDYVGGSGFDNIGKFAGFQWDEPSEFAQVINYIQYGHKEDHLYVNVGKVSAATVGHGTLARRYNPNIDMDHYHVSAQLDKGFEYGGLEFYTNDIMRFGMIGALGYVKPLKPFFSDIPLLRSLSVGGSYVSDRTAPYVLAMDPNDSSHVVTGEYLMPQVIETSEATLLGLDAEVKVFKRDQVDVKTYADYSRLTLTGGDGLSVGTLVRLNVGGGKEDERVHAFRLRGEVGLYHPQYAPGYFDMFYELEKYQYGLAGADEVIPKLRYLDSQTGGYRAGGRLEATYSIVHGPGLAAAWQGSQGGRDSQLLLHVEAPTGTHLRFLVTYVRNNLQNGGTLFALDDPNSLLVGRARLKILPILFVNAEVTKMYRLKSAESDATVATVPDIGDPAQFRNVLRWVLETEVGFEF